MRAERRNRRLFICIRDEIHMRHMSQIRITAVNRTKCHRDELNVMSQFHSDSKLLNTTVNKDDDKMSRHKKNPLFHNIKL